MHLKSLRLCSLLILASFIIIPSVDIHAGGNNSTMLKPGYTKEDCSKKLLEAVMNGHLNEVEGWISMGAHVDYVNYNGHSPLLYASTKGYAQTVAQLLAAGADVNIKDPVNGKDTPLLLAAQQGHTEIVKILLANKADVNAIDRFSYNALEWFQARGDKETVELINNHINAANQPN